MEGEREGEGRGDEEEYGERERNFVIIFSPEPTQIESVASLWNPRVNILTLKNLYSKQVPPSSPPSSRNHDNLFGTL